MLMEALYKVHLNDGTTKIVTGEQLAALDPGSWHAQEPAERGRWVVLDSMANRRPVYVVHDRAGEAPDEPYGTPEVADARADALNKEHAS